MTRTREISLRILSKVKYLVLIITGVITHCLANNFSVSPENEDQLQIFSTSYFAILLMTEKAIFLSLKRNWTYSPLLVLLTPLLLLRVTLVPVATRLRLLIPGPLLLLVPSPLTPLLLRLLPPSATLLPLLILVPTLIVAPASLSP